MIHRFIHWLDLAATYYSVEVFNDHTSLVERCNDCAHVKLLRHHEWCECEAGYGPPRPSENK